MGSAGASPGLELSGKIAVVTGGSRGLGRSIVHAFARAGADVIIASRSAESCRRTAEEVAAQSGVRAVPRACHVGQWQQVDDLVAFAYEEFGRVDVLVNNAGMSPLYDAPESVTEELWRKVIDVNLSGPFRLMALIGSRMAAGEGGKIINVSSVAAWHPTADVIPYAAAKAGLNAMTVGFARAFGPTVRVNAIVAGAFLTDVSTGWDMSAFERQARGFALGRAGTPDEIAGAALFLATDASSYTTGALLQVDGGYLAGPS